MGILQEHNISIGIDGHRLACFKSFRLVQRIGEHHNFELVIDLETGYNRYVHNLKDSAGWLGKTLAVLAGAPEKATFLGVVTNVSLQRQNSDFGCIVVKGSSMTYLLENEAGCRSWNGLTIGDIISRLASDAGVTAQVSPEYGRPLGYMCQYGESDFTFIRRLARQYGEWMYYDGLRLVFGKPSLPRPVRLEFGTDLSSLDVGVQTLARPSRVFSYKSITDHEFSEATPDISTGQDLLGHKAFDASMEMFKTPSHQYALSRVLYPQELTDYVRRKQQGQAAASHYVECTSENASLTVGSVVDVTSSFLERVGSLSSDGIGEFIITEIEHTVSEDRYYSNRFRGIPSTVQTLPQPDVPMPVAESQMGVVVSNADPDGKGRVQVRMVWQTDDMRTDWLRVMTPDGGGSDDVRTNRGFVFIPEVGDHVLVGFRHGDPNRPYVMGSLFSGKTGGGGGEGNKCKSLTTRSGSSLKLDDSDGSVTLHDKGGVSMNFDGGGNYSLNASSKSTTSVGKGGASILTMDSNGNIDLSGKAQITIRVGGTAITIKNEEVRINSKNIIIEGENNTVIGTHNKVNGETAIEGPKVFLKGAPVKVN
ncbi:type VI secretion system Vgr family protein [Prevotella sp. KH2C16]|uniref:type VI secretion system Vgr family protein n=1 Tax=Prevotella sp. KH2C16 TaxID=1855325 RepID=UPI0008E953A2|nr:phage baseplate assembly protein V [Prevotella sp. KH2C16]SFG71682.1 Rhs element Vgr protein [Prevotella sp. KH2C16]